MALRLDVADNERYAIVGDTTTLLKNKGLLISLKRLKYKVEDDKIFIPHTEQNASQILQTLNSLLKNYGYELESSNDVQGLCSSFEREERLFDTFSTNARTIRENLFNEYPELVEKFNDFQSVLASTMVRRLYDLQLLSAFHLAFTQNACNFAVPGAGKTSIVYGAYSYLKNLPKSDPRHVDYIMVVGPLSSFAPWENEYEACFGRKAESQRLSGDADISKELKIRHLYSVQPAELTLVFHGGVAPLQKEITDFLRDHKTMLVIDEAHRIKNPEGVWGKSVTDISMEAVSRVILTGTPVPNGYEDLYNLFKFIYPYKYKSIMGFHYQNLKNLTDYPELNASRIEELKNSIAPFYIRIKKKDLNLPAATEEIIPVAMDEFQRRIYDTIEDKYIGLFMDNPSASIKDFLNKARLIRMRQASTNPALLLKPLAESMEFSNDVCDQDPNAAFASFDEGFGNDVAFYSAIKQYANEFIPNKYKKVAEVVKSIIEAGGKVIIWSIFIQNAHQLRKYLKSCGISSRLLIGSTPQADREDIIEDFNNPNDHSFNVVIANPFAVSESISIHKGCHNAIYLERDYNASHFIQSKDRIHRVGLPKDCVTKYYYIVSENSIDEVIDNRLREKVARMEEIIDDDIPLFTRINDSDETDIIKDLINQYARRNS